MEFIKKSILGLSNFIQIYVNMSISLSVSLQRIKTVLVRVPYGLLFFYCLVNLFTFLSLTYLKWFLSAIL